MSETSITKDFWRKEPDLGSLDAGERCAAERDVAYEEWWKQHSNNEEGDIATPDRALDGYVKRLNEKISEYPAALRQVWDLAADLQSRNPDDPLLSGGRNELRHRLLDYKAYLDLGFEKIEELQGADMQDVADDDKPAKRLVDRFMRRVTRKEWDPNEKKVIKTRETVPVKDEADYQELIDQYDTVVKVLKLAYQGGIFSGYGYKEPKEANKSPENGLQTADVKSLEGRAKTLRYDIDNLLATQRAGKNKSEEKKSDSKEKLGLWKRLKRFMGRIGLRSAGVDKPKSAPSTPEVTQNNNGEKKDSQSKGGYDEAKDVFNSPDKLDDLYMSVPINSKEMNVDEALDKLSENAITSPGIMAMLIEEVYHFKDTNVNKMSAAMRLDPEVFQRSQDIVSSLFEKLKESGKVKRSHVGDGKRYLAYRQNNQGMLSLSETGVDTDTVVLTEDIEIDTGKGKLRIPAGLRISLDGGHIVKFK